MPRLIDWGVRFELIREAVVRIAAREGSGAVTIDSVAAELRVSSTTLRRTLSPPTPEVLRGMGLDYIVRMRRIRSYMIGRPPGSELDSVEHIAWVLANEIPTDEQHLEQEQAWVQLTFLGAGEASVEHRVQHDAYLDSFVRGCLARLGTEEATREVVAIHLRALVDGLTSALCRSSISGEEATDCLTTHLRRLTPPTSLRPVSARPQTPAAHHTYHPGQDDRQIPPVETV
jgi:hypothetical protein